MLELAFKACSSIFSVTSPLSNNRGFPGKRASGLIQLLIICIDDPVPACTLDKFVEIGRGFRCRQV